MQYILESLSDVFLCEILSKLQLNDIISLLKMTKTSFNLIKSKYLEINIKYEEQTQLVDVAYHNIVWWPFLKNVIIHNRKILDEITLLRIRGVYIQRTFNINKRTRYSKVKQQAALREIIQWLEDQIHVFLHNIIGQYRATKLGKRISYYPLLNLLRKGSIKYKSYGLDSGQTSNDARLLMERIHNRLFCGDAIQILIFADFLIRCQAREVWIWVVSYESWSHNSDPYHTYSCSSNISLLIQALMILMQILIIIKF